MSIASNKIRSGLILQYSVSTDLNTLNLLYFERAITSCKESGNRPDYHFAGAGKMMVIGKGAQREGIDYQLSRFACYLIAQNGDPRKLEIANAQKYFAVHTPAVDISTMLARNHCVGR